MLRSRIYAGLMASAAIAPLAGVAYAGNFGFISQLDDSNLAYLIQSGSNQGFIYQHGNGNVFAPATGGSSPGLAQEGTNSLGVEQLGNGNFIGGIFHQFDKSVGEIAQFGV